MSVRELFNVACPNCGSDGDLLVAVCVWARLSVDGTEPVGDHDWDNESGMICLACRTAGKVGTFRAVWPQGEVQS